MSTAVLAPRSGTALRKQRTSVASRVRPSVIHEGSQVVDSAMMDSVEFGIFGKRMPDQFMLRDDCIAPLASWLAQHTEHPNPNAALISAQQAYPEWFLKYGVIDGFDRSLMLPGHCPLIFHLVEDPHQIADNPPRETLELLTRAYSTQPEGTRFFYAEPVFTQAVQGDGLPVATTLDQMQAELGSRFRQAQAMARSWGWYYRLSRRVDNWIAERERRAEQARLQAEIARKQAEAEAERAKAEEQRTHELARLRFQQMQGLARSVRDGASMRGLEVPTLPLPSRRRGGSDEARMRELMQRYEALRGEFPELDSITHRALTPVVMRFFRHDPLLLFIRPDEPGLFRLISHWFWQQLGEVKKLHVHHGM